MQFRALPESSHALVALRPVEARDLPAWYAYLSLPVVHEHTSSDIESAAALETHLWTAETCDPSSPLRFAISLRSHDQLIGTAGFHSVSAQNKSAELAYDIAPDFWRKGIATQVCSDLVIWAHSDVGLLRVQAVVLDSNARSSRVLQRCGFEHEGLLRSYRMVRGKAGDFHMYSHVLPTGT